MKRFFSLVLFVLPVTLLAQGVDSLTLDQCQGLARENYPLIRQKQLLGEASALRTKNIGTTWLPQLSVNGQATYQSAVTEVPQMSPLFSPPVISKDQYKFTLDLNQSVWDGGTSSAQSALEKAGLNVDIQNIEVELYKIKERVNQIYFSILLAQQNEKILKILREDLQARLDKTLAGVRNGTQLRSNASLLEAEILKNRQQLTEVYYTRLSALSMLGEFINRTLVPGTVLLLPAESETPAAFVNQRPELLLFDMQASRLEVSKKNISTRIIPRVFVFGQTGLGRPGLNMLSNDFDFFYYVGAKITWNISGFYQTGTEKRICDLQQSVVQTQRETFEKNLRISSQKDLSDISRLVEIISQDNEIIILREQITKNALVQYENGVCTATEYINEKNAEMQARLNLELHRIQLQMARINYLNSMGK